MAFYSAQNISATLGGCVGIYLGVWASLTFTDALDENDLLVFEDANAMNHITAATAMVLVPLTAWLGQNVGMALPSMPSRMSSARQQYQSSEVGFWAKTNLAIKALVDDPEEKSTVHDKLGKLV